MMEHCRVGGAYSWSHGRVGGWRTDYKTRICRDVVEGGSVGTVFYRI